MFNQIYSFTGTHADRVRRLTAELAEGTRIQVFKRNLDVYIIAPVVGFLYGRMAEANSSKEINPTKIFVEQLASVSNELGHNYALIMLAHYANELSVQERLDKAFRFFNTDKAKADEDVYDAYVLGGVDVLYEKLIAENEGNAPEHVARRLMEFLQEFDNRYSKAVEDMDVDGLLRAARDF